MRAKNQREAAMGKQGAKGKAEAKAGPTTGAKRRNEPGFDNARLLRWSTRIMATSRGPHPAYSLACS